MSHANAALTPRARLRLARLVVDEGWPVARAAERYNVSWPTAKRWADRYRAAGAAGMADRPSRPHRVANRTPAPLVRRIVHLRWKQRLGPVQIGDRVGLAPSTVHAVLVRCRLSRLRDIDRTTGEPVRRYEHPHPGSLLHVDVKKLGNIPDGGGHRFVGRRQGNRNRSRTAGAGRNVYGNPKVGTAFVHTAIDDHSRVAYAEIHDDEHPATAAAVLRRAVTWFAARGRHRRTRPVRQRQLLPKPPMAGYLRRARHPAEAHPSLPAADQRQDRTLPPHPRRRLVQAPPLQQRVRPPSGATVLAARVQPPPAPHRHRQGPVHHPVDQPAWSVHLAGRT